MGCSTELTEGEASGRVRLATDADADAEHVVQLHRDAGTVVRDGSPYLSAEQNRVAARRFAFLDETNPVRRAVRNGEPFEEVLLESLQFENIEERIAGLQREREQVESELESAESAATELPTVEESIRDLEEELSELERRREQRAASDEVSEKREELSDALSEREQVESRIQRLERTIETIEGKIEEKRATLEEVSPPEIGEDLAAELDDLREKQQRMEEAADLLQSIYGPVKRLFDEGRLDLVSDTEHGLLADTTTCWTCGQEATEDQIADQLERLSERVTEHRRRANEHQRRIEELSEQQREREEAKRRRNVLEADVSNLEERLADRTKSLENSRERLEQLEERIDDLSAAVEDLDDERTELESEIKYARTRLEETRERKAELETEASRRETLEAERDDLTDEIHQFRERKERIKREMREAFDAAMGEIVPRFAVGFESARLTDAFELVVARDGHEVERSALSGGETELLGVVVALAGFEAFDVADVSPVLLLDDLGSLSETNLRTLVEYLESRSAYLVFTSYPEHSIPEANVVDLSDWEVATESVTA